MKSLFGKGGAPEAFAKYCKKEDFVRIRDGWLQKCEWETVPLSAKVMKELQKRVDSGDAKGCKAKLDLRGLGINDKQLRALLEVLAQAPVIAKVELDKNNISDAGASVIRKLLKGQTKLVAANPLDVRLEANFLCDVSLTGSTQDIKPELLADIAALSDTLRFANAQACIRKTYLDTGGPETINGPFLGKMWVSILGKEDKPAIVQALSSGKTYGDHLLSYDEMEAALLSGLTAAKLVPVLSKQQKKAIEVPSSPLPAPAPVVAEASSSEPDIQPVVHSTANGTGNTSALIPPPPPPPSSSPVPTPTAAASAGSPQNSPKFSDGLASSSSSFRHPDSPKRTRTKQPVAESQPPSPKLTDRAVAEAHMAVVYHRIVEGGGLSPVSPVSPVVHSGSPSASALSPAPKSPDLDGNVKRFRKPTVSYQHSTWTGPPITGIVSTAALKRAILSSPPRARPDGRSISPSPPTSPIRGGGSSPDRAAASKEPSNFQRRDMSPARNLMKNANSKNSATGSGNAIALRKGLSPQRNLPSGESKGERDDRKLMKRLFLKPRRKMQRVPDAMLNLSNLRLETLDVPNMPLTAPTTLQSILVLNISHNKLSDFPTLALSSLKNMTDLDMSHNLFQGPLPLNFIPASIKRLDLSNNKITEISTLLSCLSLTVLNVSSNSIKKIDGLPPSLDSLDISNNLIKSVFALRLLSLSSRITQLKIAGNPVVMQTTSDGPNAGDDGAGAGVHKKELEWHTVINSVLPLLVNLDGVPVPSKHNAKKRLVAQDKVTAALKASSSSSAIMSPGGFKSQSPGGFSSISSYGATARGSSPPARRRQQELDAERAQLSRAREERVQLSRQEYDAAMEAEARARTKTISKTDMQKLLSRLSVSKNQPVSSKAAVQMSLAEKQARDGAVFRIKEWIQDSSMDMGQASSVLRVLFDMLSRGGATVDALANFLRQLQRVPFIKGVKLHPSINNSVGKLAREETVLDDLAVHLEHMVGLSTLLQDVERVVEEKLETLEAELGKDSGMGGAVVSLDDLRAHMDDLFCGEVGVAANERVLRMFDNEYIIARPSSNSSGASRGGGGGGGSSGSRGWHTAPRNDDDEEEAGRRANSYDRNEYGYDQDLQKIAQGRSLSERGVLEERGRVFSRMAEEGASASERDERRETRGHGTDRVTEAEAAARMEEVKQRLSMRAMMRSGGGGGTSWASTALPASNAAAVRTSDFYQESDDGNVSISTDLLGSEDLESATSNVMLASVPTQGGVSSTINNINNNNSNINNNAAYSAYSAYSGYNNAESANTTPVKAADAAAIQAAAEADRKREAETARALDTAFAATATVSIPDKVMAVEIPPAPKDSSDFIPSVTSSSPVRDQRESLATSPSEHARAAKAAAAQQATAAMEMLNKREADKVAAAAAAAADASLPTPPPPSVPQASATATTATATGGEEEGVMSAKDRIKARLAALKKQKE